MEPRACAALPETGPAPGRYIAEVSGQVFLSYRHDGPDRAYVEQLAGYLAGNGVDVRFDREPAGGQRWPMVERQINEAAAVVVVMTPGASASDWVQHEINQAFQAGRPLFPLLLAGLPFHELGGHSYEDVSDGRMPGHAFVAELVALQSQPYGGQSYATGQQYTAGQQYTPQPPPVPRPAPAAPRANVHSGASMREPASEYPYRSSAGGPPPQPRQPYRPTPPPPPPPPPRSGRRLPKVPLLSLILRLACSGAAVWISTLLLSGITVHAKTTAGTVGTVVLVAVIFGVINAVLKPIVKFVGCGLYVLTLGLISLVVNGALFLLASFVAGKLDIPFHVDKFWPSAVLGALLVSVVSWGLGLIVKDRGDH